MSDVELIERLALAAFLGGLLGIEREWRNKSAGLRTNILIAMGSALFTLMSIDMAKGTGGDSTRIAAQIVTGIGFLGAGAIMRTGVDIQGLTTAAMIWVNAALGVAVGAGEYRVAVVATGVALLALVLLGPVERLIERRRPNHRRRSTDVEPSAGDAAGPEPGARGAPPRPTPR
jgi:putative Mg2+ transporter-C (MgtC) family protein